MQSPALKSMVRTLLRRSPGIESALRGLYLAAHFHPVSPENFARVSERLSASWMADGIPGEQWAVVEPQLAAYRAGKPSPTFDALVDILVHNVNEFHNRSLLEIGCSSGYLSEVLLCKGVEALYQGCDFSPAFIRLARQMYPSIRFDVEDATGLSYGSNSFDIVVSGCCLLHIPEYEKAIAEAARVSREYVVFHRTPVLHMTGPAFYTKNAYGIEMLEIHFHEQQLVRMFVTHKLYVVDINSQLSLPESRRSDPLIYKTYLCQKVK
jgi:ubiquinone/menaquinone biosynthesis C-methylase UbiE